MKAAGAEPEPKPKPTPNRRARQIKQARAARKWKRDAIVHLDSHDPAAVTAEYGNLTSILERLATDGCGAGWGG
jgi:hypothetical protein